MFLNSNTEYNPTTKVLQKLRQICFTDLDSRRQDRNTKKKIKEKQNRNKNQRIQNQNNRKTFYSGNKNKNLLPQPSSIRDCDYYTDNLCLKVANYPKEQIVGLLSGRNRRVGNDLIADVLDQSADELIDGVTSAQENRYTFSHYFGNADRREG